MKLTQKGCDNCFYYDFPDRKCKANENCIGAGSYDSWEAKYKCNNTELMSNYDELGHQCQFFVYPGFCVAIDERWCKQDREDIHWYEDKCDKREDKIKKLKEMFS